MKNVKTKAQQKGPAVLLQIESFSAVAQLGPQGAGSGSITLRGTRKDTSDTNLSFVLNFLPDGSAIPVPTYDNVSQLAILYFCWSQYAPILELLQSSSNINAAWMFSLGLPWAEVDWAIASIPLLTWNVPPRPVEPRVVNVSLDIQSFDARIYANNLGKLQVVPTLGLIILNGIDEASGQTWSLYISGMLHAADVRPPYPADDSDLIYAWLTWSDFNALMTSLQSGGQLRGEYDGTGTVAQITLNFSLDDKAALSPKPKGLGRGASCVNRK